MLNEETNFRRTVRVKSRRSDLEESTNVVVDDGVNYDEVIQSRRGSANKDDVEIYDVLMKVYYVLC